MYRIVFENVQILGEISVQNRVVGNYKRSQTPHKISVTMVDCGYPYSRHHTLVSIRSRARRGVQVWLFLCSTQCAENPHNERFVPAGSVYVHANSSIHVDGGSSFMNNYARRNGGEKRPRPGTPYQRKADACLVRWFGVELWNSILIDDDNGTVLLRGGFCVLSTPDDRVFIVLPLNRVCSSTRRNEV